MGALHDGLHAKIGQLTVEVDYLLRDLTVARPNHVWCNDITYVPMPGGHTYLCAVMDWYSRKVQG